MHVTSIVGLCVAALASTAAAVPRFAGPYHGDRISIHVPANGTASHSATASGTRGKMPLATGLSKPKNQTTGGKHHGPNLAHVPNHVKHINHCHELCSLEAQTCTIAVPEDDKFW
ncbi:hypothetical protein N7492_006935 [Penicillium capsulatum]|uniref:Uncharacterized protein n=1 Tax=Penicillium capsulatum TaxID=69766 RepID=A0A9W9HYY4_9EURO|nr:hypothetical protein N7492_006935 [Penicillium capsulatum]KAJ6116768.1 hypothetical protein N7512_006493 [Penicillium capsulatum]